jgi:cellulose synthase/poly-beta-1,6-N-acetylglucosamine synthase-like glycosyltransferase
MHAAHRGQSDAPAKILLLLVKDSSIMPNISLSIPVYNWDGLLPQTLRSLFGQALMTDEIIVVDVGSSNATAEAAVAEFSALSRQSSAKKCNGYRQNGSLRCGRLRRNRCSLCTLHGTSHLEYVPFAAMHSACQ